MADADRASSGTGLLGTRRTWSWFTFERAAQMQRVDDVGDLDRQRQAVTGMRAIHRARLAEAEQADVAGLELGMFGRISPSGTLM